ncbi:putative beta-xylosidase-like protein [Emericellopsis cladophorae]|uniref:Beta-xylosidase-like protein n=1 Tax=Emericellopsis cladophorae TaxID=2686198 RepID=A0A9P9Y8D4_9HYPO|nr:putative beta-xylosidase-like protein [Emericellopsis cladophorae]KAI6785503.1 putative beta-xylosidase-like protein [Emericellopsis cladophorae]
MKLLNILSLAAVAVGQFTNPVIYQDLADLDVIRVEDTFYYSASTMHYSPGAPVLKSYNLVDWEFIGHSVPRLDFGEAYNLPGDQSAYVRGIWASGLQYRKSNGLFYWYGCMSGTSKTYVYTATDPAGEWTLAGSLDKCYYDLGVLVDDNDTMYLAYGAYTIGVAQLSDDGLSVVRDQTVWEDLSFYLEGARFYHIDGRYYIWLTHPADEQHVLRADNPWGPYTQHTILQSIAAPIPYSGVPHQGGIVDTPNGDWYYMGFLDAYPAGRVPVLAPIRWEDGWPYLVTDSNGGWGREYPMPDIQTDKSVNPAGPFTEDFQNGMNVEFEWNHNPDNSAWSTGSDGLTLNTASVTNNFYQARNTLTHRTIGPKSSATWRLNVGDMVSGDVAGAVLIRDESAYIGVSKGSCGSVSLVFVNNLILEEQNGSWQTTAEGNIVATETQGLRDIASGDSDIWLRVTADVTPTFGRSSTNSAIFEWSTDGQSFTQLGPVFPVHNRWQFFMAFRYGVFNFAKQQLGGSVLVKEFDLQLA